MDNHPNINCWFCGAEQTDLVKRISELEAERSELLKKDSQNAKLLQENEHLKKLCANQYDEIKELKAELEFLKSHLVRIPKVK